MPYNTLFTFAIATLLLACGGEATNEPTAAPDAAYNDLASRVSKLTGKEYRMDPANPGPGQNNAGAERSATTLPGNIAFRTEPIRSEGFSMPAGWKQVPAHWQASPGGTGYTAPGVVVKTEQGPSYKYIQGELASFYEAAGGAQAPPKSMDQLLQQDLVPMMRQQGYQLVAHSPLPKAQHNAGEYLQSVAIDKSMAPNAQVGLSEWKSGDRRMAMVTVISTFASPTTTSWTYSMDRLETSAAQYEREKAGLVATAENQHPNPQFIAAYRQRQMQQQAQWQQAEDVRTRQSWATFNHRMQANQAAFDAQQRTHRETWDAINSASMSSFQDRMSSMDRMQNATINAIRGEQDAYNPYTGESGKIQSGYDNYWMNRDGQYMGTNSVLYDPNVNSDWTDQWRQVPTKP